MEKIVLAVAGLVIAVITYSKESKTKNESQNNH